MTFSLLILRPAQKELSYLPYTTYERVKEAIIKWQTIQGLAEAES